MKSLKLMMLAVLAALPVLGAGEKAVPLNLKVGQKVSMVLDGNPTTGYIWQQTGDAPADGPVQVELSCVAAESDGMCCGFPTPTTLTITAVKPGKQLVHVVYARPWEKGIAPAAEKCYEVKVSPAQN